MKERKEGKHHIKVLLYRNGHWTDYHIKWIEVHVCQLKTKFSKIFAGKVKRWHSFILDMGKSNDITIPK